MAEQGRKRIGFWPRIAGLGVASSPILEGAIAAANGSPWLAAGLVSSAPFVYRATRITASPSAPSPVPPSRSSPT